VLARPMGDPPFCSGIHIRDLRSSKPRQSYQRSSDTTMT
jgi:hypothetical protein